MKAAITAPDSDTGDIMGDLNGKRARILGMNPNGTARRPSTSRCPRPRCCATRPTCARRPRARARSSIEFDHYDPVPGHLTQRVVEALAEAEASRA